MNTTELHIPSNKVRDIEQYIQSELGGLYPKTELRMFISMLFEAFLGWDKVKLLLHRDDTINQSDLLKFHWAVEDLKKYRPIQHIIGYTEFCNCIIKVTPDTLIPRPETEELVNNAEFQISDSDSKLAILDLCTGSGCIAIAMARQYPDAEVYAVDISEQALAVAQHNAEDNLVKIHFAQCDLLHNKPQLPLDQFDIIISNPPYVCEKERTAIRPNVLDYEPALALFVPDNDPLRFYRAITQYATEHLRPNGLLLFEINENLGQETLTLVQNLGFKAELIKDFWGKDRFIRGKRS